MNKTSLPKYFWQIIYSHTIAYFIAGILAFFVMNYREAFASSPIMRSVDAPIVALGPFLQIFRGIIIALILLPLRKAFFEEKHGLLKLGLVVAGFSLISTIGPPPCSFEGFIYTKIPFAMHMYGYPEAILYLALFIGLLSISKKYGDKMPVNILSIILVLLISVISITGFIMAGGRP